MRMQPRSWKEAIYQLIGWAGGDRKSRRRARAQRRARVERLESRQLLTADLQNTWHNVDAPADVNDDGNVTSLDALIVVNHVNSSGITPVSGPTPAAGFLDVDNNQVVDFRDIDAVIEVLDAPPASDGIQSAPNALPMAVESDFGSGSANSSYSGGDSWSGSGSDSGSGSGYDSGSGSGTDSGSGSGTDSGSGSGTDSGSGSGTDSGAGSGTDSGSGSGTDSGSGSGTDSGSGSGTDSGSGSGTDSGSGSGTDSGSGSGSDSGTTEEEDTYTITVENGSVVEGGSFSPSYTYSTTSDASVASITFDWGDGSASETLSPGSGSGHIYRDDNPSSTPVDIVSVGVTVVWSDGNSASGTAELAIHNAAPAVEIDSVEPIYMGDPTDNGQTEEGEGFTIKGRVTDAGVDDSHTATLKIDLNFDGDKDDAGETETVSLTPTSTAGEWTFEHTVGAVLDDGALYDASHEPIWGNGSPSDPLSFTIEVKDDDTGTGTAGDAAEILNLAPSMPNRPQISYERDADGYLLSATVTGVFVDAGAYDFHKVKVNWGDGVSTGGDGSLERGRRDFEITRTFDSGSQVTLSDIVNSSLVIADDDGGSKLVSDIKAAWLEILDAEAEEDGGSIQFSVKLHGATNPFTLYYKTTNGTAYGTEQSIQTPSGMQTFRDYDGVPAEDSISFTGTKGEIATITIALDNDGVIEKQSETFLVKLLRVESSSTTYPANVTIFDAQAKGTILDDDAGEISLTLNASSLSEDDPPMTAAQFTYLPLLLASTGIGGGVSDTDVIISYHIEDTTSTPLLEAESGKDFTDTTLTAGQITIPAYTHGPSIANQIIIDIINDNIVESAGEDFRVVLDGISFADGPRKIKFEGNATSLTTISTIDDDDSAELYIVETGVAVVEGTSGILNTKRYFTLRLSAEVDIPFTTTVGTRSIPGSLFPAMPDSSTEDADYEAMVETFTFTGAAFETKSFKAEIIADSRVEFDEDFGFSIVAHGIGDRAITIVPPTPVTIVDDDLAKLSISAASAREADSTDPDPIMTFTVTLDKPVPGVVTAVVTLAPGSATSADYNLGPFGGATPYTISFAPEQLTTTFSVSIYNDDFYTGDRSFTASIGSITSGGLNVTLGEASAEGTIEEDEWWWE